MISFPRDLQTSSTRLMFGGSIFATLYGEVAVRHRSGGSVREGGWYSESSQSEKGKGKSESDITLKLEKAVKKWIKAADINKIVLDVDAGFDAYIEGFIVDDTGTTYRRFMNWLCSTVGFPTIYYGKISVLGNEWNLEIHDARWANGNGSIEIV